MVKNERFLGSFTQGGSPQRGLEVSPSLETLDRGTGTVRYSYTPPGVFEPVKRHRGEPGRKLEPVGILRLSLRSIPHVQLQLYICDLFPTGTLLSLVSLIVCDGPASYGTV